MTDNTSSRQTSRKETGPFRSVGSVLDLLLSLLRKMPIAGVVLVVAILVYYQRPSEEPLLRFSKLPDSASVSLPAPDPETGSPLALVQWVKTVDTNLARDRWGEVYLGMEVQPDGKALTIVVTDKWQELSLDKRKEMIQEVIEAWVTQGQTLGLLKSAAELEAVNFKQASSERPVATWRPASGSRLLSSG